MTANVAQAIVEPLEWTVTLRAIHAAVRPGGHLAFETRNPAVRAWESWNCAASHATVHVQDVGIVESWHDLMNVDGPLVTFRSTVTLPDGERIVSESTLRFRTHAEVEADLSATGFRINEVRDAPDRPGRELVFLAERN